MSRLRATTVGAIQWLRPMVVGRAGEEAEVGHRYRALRKASCSSMSGVAKAASRPARSIGGIGFVPAAGGGRKETVGSG
jgi:hypothetical protein